MVCCNIFERLLTPSEQQYLNRILTTIEVAMLSCLYHKLISPTELAQFNAKKLKFKRFQNLYVMAVNRYITKNQLVLLRELIDKGYSIIQLGQAHGCLLGGCLVSFLQDVDMITRQGSRWINESC